MTQNPKTRTAQVRLAAKRRRKSLRRKRVLEARRRRGWQGRTSGLLGFIARAMNVSPGKPDRETVIRFPSEFSFIDNPDATMDSLRGLVRASLTRGVKVLDIDQSECMLIDHGAASVLSAVGIEARSSIGLRFRGSFPESERERHIVLSTGLPKALGVDLPEPQGFLHFPLRSGRRGTPDADRSQLAEVTATQISEHVNRCLERYEFCLTYGGARYVSSLVGEVLGNAEDHSGRRKWWVSGYLRQAPNKPYGTCHITIFSFGRTIAETMSDLPEDSMLARRMDELIHMHSRRALFLPGKWEPDNLRTVYALQEGVSRHNTGTHYLGDRGKGTADLIDFFQRLGQSGDGSVEPRMCLVSGRTHISFDERFPMKEMRFQGRPARVIAFNKANDLENPPDPKAVRWLKRPFPGTLISLRFYLDAQHLKRIRRPAPSGETPDDTRT